MEIKFKLYKQDQCGVKIEGIDTYDKEGDYEKTMSINILIPMDANKNYGTAQYSVNTHDLENEDITVMNFLKDGLHKIIHIVVEKSKYEYKDNKLYNKDGTEISISDILADESLTQDYLLTFNSCELQNCFFKHSNEVLHKHLDMCPQKIEKEFDILWIGTHVIRYLLELNRLYEAQYILEKLSGCSGVCKSSNNKINECNCKD